jgi:sugar lactone lactonase YvrE
MRKLLLALVLFVVLAGAIAFIIIRQINKPLPTPVGWKAHVTIVAGDGSPRVSDRQGREAQFSDPFGIAVAPDGTIYVADAGESNRIRKIAPDGSVTTFAGVNEGFGDGANASFNTPSGLALDSVGNLFVADTGNNRIRKISPDGQVSTLAGDGTAGYADGPAAQARFNGPIDVAVDDGGNIYVADSYNDRIRMISSDGQVSTVAGAGTPGYADGARNAALFDTPCGVTATTDGTIIVADTGNDRLRKVSPEGNVTTIPVTGNLQDLSSPVGLALSHDNFIYVTEQDRSRVVQVAPDGTANIIAGDIPGFAGASNEARFNQPAGIAIGPHSNKPVELYVADSGNYLIRKLDQTAVASAATLVDPNPKLTKKTLEQQSLIWPIDPQQSPHEVVATVGEVRGSFDSTDSRHHLHSGLDVFGGYGEIVRAIRSEKVISPLPNWGFASLNEGFRAGIISYIHIHVGRDKDAKMFDDPRFVPVNDGEGKLWRVRIKRGTRFRAGDALGTINKMYHVHLNVGPPGGEINPLSLSLVGFKDDIPPTIEKDGVQLFDANGARFKEKQGERLVVNGPVRIIVDAFDRTNMNGSRRRLGLYKLGYQVLKTDGTPAPGYNEPRINIVFDRLPSEREATKIAYASESGITVYGSAATRFLYEVTNTVRDGRAAQGVWDASQLPKGDYVLRIIAADFSGNEAQEGRDVLVTVR